MIADNTKIGTGLLAMGAIFLFFGVVFLFEPGLLAMGEMLLLVAMHEV